MQQMKDVVNYSETRRQQYKGNHGGFVYRFEKTVSGKRLVVVAEVKGSEAWLMTGWEQQ